MKFSVFLSGLRDHWWSLNPLKKEKIPEKTREMYPSGTTREC